MNGLLIIDKPPGCTSHDVVGRVRRKLNTRAVGHAGTLDPLASGVLVVAVGEATKLTRYLQVDDKVYEVTVALGIATDTLDREGQQTTRADVPTMHKAAVQKALDAFVGRHTQRVPVFSAVKRGGEPLHRRARRGEQVDAPEREVELHEARVLGVSESELRLWLKCGKGYFVRSLARDLAEALGTVGHVRELRRTASGAFEVDDAIGLADFAAHDAAEGLLTPMHALPFARFGLHRVWPNAQGLVDVSHGRKVSLGDLEGGAEGLAQEAAVVLLNAAGLPVALGKREGEAIRIVRGFVHQ